MITNRAVGRLSDRMSGRRIALWSCAGTIVGVALLAVAPTAAAVAVVFIVITPPISGLYGIGYPMSARREPTARHWGTPACLA